MKRKACKRQSLLIVDDDDEWRELVCGTLSRAYRMRVASNGGDGLRRARRSPPALIVLDVMMPGGMDGFGTLCELRKDPATRDIPVILCTEVNAVSELDFSPRDLEQYLGTAPEAMLEKPVKVELLLAEIERILRGPRKKSA